MYTHTDFIIPNIANAPITQERVTQICEIFGEASLRYQNLDLPKICQKMSITENTLRKMINHANLTSILENKEGVYRLSDLTIQLYYEQISYSDFIKKLIVINPEIERIKSIIETLLNLFEGSLRKKTVYYIFSLVSKMGRYDNSAVRSVARNLNPVFNLMVFGGYVNVNKEYIVICDKQAVENIFKSRQILSIVESEKNVMKYFLPDIANSVMRCAASYENDKYIWAKSSLYKNKGEVRNLSGEYIMSVMKKGENI